ncbi:DUF4223 family protein [Escherichia coli]|uniref:DUF4223 family protein n=1 Tax=Escherichia coli TaxID=562 RepID=UPI001917A463|nr:DUF4223 family protein [Escherichia coli]CAD5747266.1 secreted peptide [Escherichia coli]
MKTALKATIFSSIIAALTACSGYVENKKDNCSYEYLLHPAISVSKIIGGCGPAADTK